MLIGYSDHTLPNDMKVVEAAILLGASVIEKHFTFDKTLKGNDHYHAMDKDDLVRLRQRLDDLSVIIGSTEKAPIDSEQISRENARRSLVLSKKVKKGDILSHDNITWKRPGVGIEPSEIDSLIGKVCIKNLDEDHIINWDDFE